MMKSILFITLMFIGLTAQAKEKLTVEFSNGPVDFYADLSDSQSMEGFHVEDVSIEIPGVSHGSLYLVAEFGWGDKPYNFLCEQISQNEYGSDVFRFASAYGYATSIALLSRAFLNVEYFIVKRDGSYEISDTYPNVVYDSGFSCYEEEFIY